MEKYLNKITQGSCLELIDELPDDSIDFCCIDPPFGCNKGIQNDENIMIAGDLLSNFLIKLKPKLKQNGYVAVFWTMRNLDVCMEHVKHNFTYRHTAAMYVPKGAGRPVVNFFLPRTQAIVIGQKYVPGQPVEFHGELAEYLDQKIKNSGHTNSSLAKLLDCNSRLIMKWRRKNDKAWCLPTPNYYFKLKQLINLDDRYDFLLVRKHPNKSVHKDFKYRHDCYIVNDKHEKNNHPTQKPLSIIEDLVAGLCPKDGISLDAFCGSGTTAIAAKNTGRNFICFEISPEFVEIANKRLLEC